MAETHGPDFDNFIKTVRLDGLCVVASNHRGGIPCFNVVYELVFSDGVVWMARIPLPYNCFQAEAVSASYAATLKYVKRHSKIPVPTVFAYYLHSSPKNKVNATYILMEKLPGHQLPTLEQEDFDPDPKDLAIAHKVHQQLTDVILELASLKFSKIASLREDSDGNFFVGPYVDPAGTAYPEHRALAYETLSAHQKGPYSSISDWYKAMAVLNRRSALHDPDEEDKDVAVAEYELLAELSDKVIVKEFETGPFVVNHNDLTIQNILVGDEFNVTGILDFPGTTVPLTSLCVFPWLFSDNLAGLVTDRGAYLDVFVNRECNLPSSALQSCDIRKRLMQSAHARQSFELDLMGPFTSLVLPRLFKEIHQRRSILMLSISALPIHEPSSKIQIWTSSEGQFHGLHMTARSLNTN
ncbi:Phosphotransferase enzyme family [Aspergillus sclerotialis]|uniref:Phosphotransferase enzyme family n=1 Tax=Aspergillus sclerotialis TaxID=2070753 RepID=A0A3A2ZPG4_9EURO|nr:Phosphotransferase enzyme family [Aspergillus sclerotialis]